MAEVSRTILVGGSADRTENRFHIVVHFCKFGRKKESSGTDIPPDKLVKPRLIDRYLTATQSCDLVTVSVDTRYMCAHFCETCTRNESDIACANYCNIHFISAL